MKKMLLMCFVLLWVPSVDAGVQDTIQTNVPALKDVFAHDFYFGCLLSYPHIGFPTDPFVTGQGGVVEPNGGYLITFHMNSMGPGNNMKPQYTVDLSGSAAAYKNAATQSDRDSINTHPIIRFNGNLIAQLNWAQRQGFKFRGHTLVWYNQTPGTAFFRVGYGADSARLSKEAMTARLENYIKEVIRLLHEGWPGMLLAMDVVNEAVNDNTGTDRTSGNEWYTTFGDNTYIMKAFEFARQYSVQYGETQIKLYYNDYNTHNASKANGIVRICGPIFRAGFLDGIGMQEHDGITYPTATEWKASYAKFDTVCSEMAVTEFDVKPNSYTVSGLAQQANQVGALVKCFLEKSYRSGRGKIVNFTKDGLNDRWTFVTNSSFWDSSNHCKPAFFAAVGVAQNYNALDSLIDDADTLQQTRFTPGTWSALQSALATARAAMAAEYSASISAADTLAQARALLQTALDGLVLTGVGPLADGDVPSGFSLRQNYPNPFNPTTTIRFTIGGVVALSEGSPGGDLPGRSRVVEGRAANNVRLAVYDLLGREVALLVDEQKSPGTYEVRFDGAGLSSGVYVYRLATGDLVQTRTMMLLR